MRNDVETRRTREPCDRDDRCTPVSSTELRIYGEREGAVCLIREYHYFNTASGWTRTDASHRPLCNAVCCARI